MPLVRAQVWNEYGLGMPELYKEANREDPKAVLDGVAVAGLVGILRQLGDLAEFAAEVFHGLQEQVMSTASRSQKLTIRVKRIEAAFPPLEKAVLAQTSHIHFAYTAGSEWHPQIRNEKNLFIYNDLPRFVMDSYEVCRDPPRLHLLDKFCAGGRGSCLKRYSDPTFFKRASGSPIEEDAEKVPIDNRTRKSKKKRSSLRNDKLSQGASFSSHSGRMHGRTSSQNASTVDMTLKSDVGEHSGSCAFNLGSSLLPEELEPKELPSRLMQETDTPGSNFPVEQTQDLDDSFSCSSSQEKIAPGVSCVSWDEKEEIVESKAGNWDIDEVPKMNFDVDVQEIGAANLEKGDEMDMPFNMVDAPQSSTIESQNDEIESEPDKYMDALNTIESESENDIECHRKQEVEHCSEKDVECQTKWEAERTEDADIVSNENREDEIKLVMDGNADHNPSVIELPASSAIISNNGNSECFPDSVPSEKFSPEQIPHISGKSSDPDHSSSDDLGMSDEIHNGSQADSVISDPSPSSGSTISDMHNPASNKIITSVNDSQNSQTEFSVVHPVGFWTNGGLLGLQPSKPPDFCVSTGGQGSASKTSEAFGPPNQILIPSHEGPKGNSGTVVENAEFNEKVPGLCSEKTSLMIADFDANLEKPVSSHCNDSLDNLNGVGLSVNTSLPHGNKLPVNSNIKSTSIESDEENDDNSTRMFGLGHHLLVNGFSRKMSIGHDDESELATSTKTGVLEPRNRQRGISYQKIPRTTINEQIGNGSPVNSLTSSPPLEYMKISFNPIDGFETSKLKLQFPDGNLYRENIRDMFPSFQLVPVPAIPAHDVVSDSDDETFCRSSPYMSDDCLCHCSESNSEQWESGETPEGKDPELYDALSRLSSMESVSSCLQVGEPANSGILVNEGNKTIVAGSDAEPSLSVSLDLPSFDVINPILIDESKNNSDQKNIIMQNTTELKPVPPPPPPAQWGVSKPCFNEAEERQHALSQSLRHELDLKLLGSFVYQKHDPPPFNQQQRNDEAIALKPEKKVGQENLSGQKEANQLCGGRGMDEKEDFLHQIRTKSFNLRPTVTARPNVISGHTTNVKVTAILQKANAIRQAVGSDDDDNWSDN
ncbi:SCAR family protein, putative isoform 3 [Hibiscus syriacus]|uniref:Protein SCAR n=1 Tax=Hibiscus syriacus TaxID=106335 RepID=A0A6A3A4Y3_HIBSY|nr:protein SCAR3-like [Hibiscus syriacus]KAE8699371.1 SCAR family protein, putative isoform 3 [Hibiscus syriacus]